MPAHPKAEIRRPKAPKSEGNPKTRNPKSSPGAARTKRAGKEPRNTRNTRKKRRVFPAFRVFRVFRGSPIASILRAISERRSETAGAVAAAARRMNVPSLEPCQRNDSAHLATQVGPWRGSPFGFRFVLLKLQPFWLQFCWTAAFERCKFKTLNSTRVYAGTHAIHLQSQVHPAHELRRQNSRATLTSRWRSLGGLL